MSRRCQLILLALSSLLACLSSAAAEEVLVREGQRFTHRPWGIERPAPTLTDEEHKRGWVTFVPGDLDGIGPSAFPTRAEIDAPMRAFASPGEHEPATFGIYAAKELAHVDVQAGHFVGPQKAQIHAGNVDIRAVRIWRQMTSWNSKDYYEIPELLEKRYELGIPAGRLQQYWVTVSIPKGTKPGRYEGYIRVTVGRERRLIAFELRVLPLHLQSPAGKVWGLWPDTARWRQYTDQQILDEMRDWRAHGITCAMMYPLTHGKFTLEDGKLKADLGEFARFMDLYVREGLGAPVVASAQGLRGLVHRLLGEDADDYGPRFAALATEIIGGIEALRVEREWPEFIYHTVDEPGGRAAAQTEARGTLQILHEAGFRTFTTADVKFANEVLDPFLDVRCYSIGFCARSEEDAMARRAECDAAGDTYWWYGTGCYTGQEGNMAANRHYGGFLLDKTLADGAWAWTFQRPKANAYDDFDGAGHREAKDACITYPSPDGGPPLTPTLQWEGIREGIDDARYLATLRLAIEDVRASAKPGARAAADSAERELGRILEGIPWLGERKLTSAEAQVARWKIADSLLDLGYFIRGQARPMRPAPTGRPDVGIQCVLSDAPPRTPEAPLPVGRAPALPLPPEIDGKLGAVWDDALKIEDLVGQDGSENPHRTEAWIARGEGVLYFAFRCHEDEMGKIRAEVTEHDGPVWGDDSVEVFVDANGDARTYAHFMLNTLGTKRESRHAYTHVDPEKQRREGHASTEDVGWSVDWAGAAAACEEGWCAEIAIPTRAEGLASARGWSVNLNRTRRVPGGTEYGCWSPTFRGFNVPGRFGKVAAGGGMLGVTSVLLSAPVWGDNSATIALDNEDLVAELAARVIVDTPTGSTQRWTSFLLPPGKTELTLPYDLDRAGTHGVAIELTARSCWVSAEKATARPGPARRLLRGAREKLAGRVHGVAPEVTRLELRRELPPALELASGAAELLEGSPGFDLTATLNVGERSRRDVQITVSVMRGGVTLSEETLTELRGNKLFVNVGTAALPPGTYQAVLALSGTDAWHARATAPFGIIRGPW